MKQIKRYCQALDLVEDPLRINEYAKIHNNIWPEVRKHILDTGVIDMQIWRIGTRLFMIMDVDSHFSFAQSAAMQQENPIIQKWEQQMWQYQKMTPWTPQGEKWVLMEQLFALHK